jgi:hypothetical protein
MAFGGTRRKKATYQGRDNGALRLEGINTGRWIEDSANDRGTNVGIENVRQH